MGKQKKKRKPSKRREPMTPFIVCDALKGFDGKDIKLDPRILYLRNNHFMVDIIKFEPREPFGRILWLSIKRIDRAPIHDWRDMQKIKNMICGPSCEAIEIYPDESRLVDTSNQFHLWAFPDGYRLPFGYSERLVMVPDNTDGSNNKSRARQRPFRQGEQPDDAMTTKEAVAKFSDDPQFGTRAQGEE